MMLGLQRADTRSGTGCFIAVPLWQQWASKGHLWRSHNDVVWKKTSTVTKHPHLASETTESLWSVGVCEWRWYCCWSVQRGGVRVVIRHEECHWEAERYRAEWTSDHHHGGPWKRQRQSSQKQVASLSRRHHFLRWLLICWYWCAAVVTAVYMPLQSSVILLVICFLILSTCTSLAVFCF